MESSVFQKFVLYVATDCPGSAKALEAAASFIEDVRTIDVKDLDRPLPEWLSGTPTCVDLRVEPKRAHRGSQGIKLLQDFASEGYRQQDLPELPDDSSFDSLQEGKVKEGDIDQMLKERERQLPAQPHVQY